jgi:hypothetical protein
VSVRCHEIFNMYLLFTHYINIWDEARINILTENCVLMGYYAASCSNFLQKFSGQPIGSLFKGQGSLPPPKKQFSQYGVHIWNSTDGDKFSVAWRSMKTLALKFTWPWSFTLLCDKSVNSGRWLSVFGTLYCQHSQNTTGNMSILKKKQLIRHMLIPCHNTVS